MVWFEHCTLFCNIQRGDVSIVMARTYVLTHSSRYQPRACCFHVKSGVVFTNQPIVYPESKLLIVWWLYIVLRYMHHLCTKYWGPNHCNWGEIVCLASGDGVFYAEMWWYQWDGVFADGMRDVHMFYAYHLSIIYTEPLYKVLQPYYMSFGNYEF